MLSKEENELMTRVGPGTPAGEMLRRYWWPVAFSEEVTKESGPRKVRLLGEDFVLFRDGAGQLGLIELHCSHRGTSLEFGRVEDNGIRCCYHGWLYDVRGNCLDQPAEPADSTFKDRIKHPAFHAQDAGGLVMAYVGPEPAPLLPSYDLLVRQDGCRVVGGGEEFCNWLQRAENSADGAHSIALHAAGYPNMAMKRPTIKWEPTPFGIKETTWIEGVARPRISHFLFPSHIRHSAARIDEQPRQVIRFRVPTDDTKTTTYHIDFYPHKDGKPAQPVLLKTGQVRQSRAGCLPAGAGRLVEPAQPRARPGGAGNPRADCRPDQRTPGHVGSGDSLAAQNDSRVDRRRAAGQRSIWRDSRSAKE